MQSAQDEWRHGRTGFDGWDESVGRSRASWARLHGVAEADVAIGPQVSPFVGMVAAALEPGGAGARRAGGLHLAAVPAARPGGARRAGRLVPLDELAEAVDGGTDLVAVTAVQSADGRLADLDAIAAAAYHGARTLVDATQACGWLPFDATRFDHVVCAGYKWLLAPRGTAFLYAGAEARERLSPHLAGWYAAEPPMANLYGGPLRLAGEREGARHLAAWMSWVGQPRWSCSRRSGSRRCTHTTPRWRRASPTGSGSGRALGDRLARPAGGGRGRAGRGAGTCAGRGGLTRFSFHLANTEADVDRALDVLAGQPSANGCSSMPWAPGADAELVDAAVGGAQLEVTHAHGDLRDRAVERVVLAAAGSA